MRRPVRILLNLATGLSLLLCAGTVALWARSHGAGDHWTLGREVEAGRELYTSSGTVFYMADMGWPDLDDRTWGDEYRREFLGFGVEAGALRHFSPDFMTMSAHYTRWWFAPIWSASAAFLILPVSRCAWWAVRRRRERLRTRAGRCPACGYDCRATPDRCPECGMVLPTADAAATRGAE